MVRCPSDSRCSVASRAPSSSSVRTTSTPAAVTDRARTTTGTREPYARSFDALRVGPSTSTASQRRSRSSEIACCSERCWVTPLRTISSPCSAAAAYSGAIRSAWNSFPTPNATPSRLVRLLPSRLARRSGLKPSSAAARRTRSRFLGLAPGRSRNTMETRARDTPARVATSSMVGGRPGSAVGASVGGPAPRSTWSMGPRVGRGALRRPSGSPRRRTGHGSGPPYVSGPPSRTAS